MIWWCPLCTETSFQFNFDNNQTILYTYASCQTIEIHILKEDKLWQYLSFLIILPWLPFNISEYLHVHIYG